MSPRDVIVWQQVLDEAANALRVAVLVAEHLELATRAAAQDAVSLGRSLRRASDALQKARDEGASS